MHSLVRPAHAELALELVAQAIVSGQSAARFRYRVDEDRSITGRVIKNAVREGNDDIVVAEIYRAENIVGEDERELQVG